MPDTYPFGQAVAWRPDDETIAASNLAAFWRQRGLDSYEALLAWANEDVARFWDAVMDDLGIEFYRPYTQVMDASGGIERPRWCVDGQMNIVHNLLDKWQGTEVASRAALRYESEEGEIVVMSYAELHEAVCTCAAALRTLGLGKGDAIGLYMPMTPELVIAFLATAKIGGIIIPLFSGYGATAVSSRLADAEAKALFVSDGIMRRGPRRPPQERGRRGAGRLPLRPVRVRPRALRRGPAGDGSAHDGQPRPDLGRADGDWRQRGAARDGAHRRGGPGDDHLHQRHHRPAEGRRAHPLRLPHQGRAGHAPPDGPQARRGDVVDDRHGLDDGPLAGLRHAPERRHDGPLRRRARTSPTWAARGSSAPTTA
jgi:hypothetical protein